MGDDLPLGPQVAESTRISSRNGLGQVMELRADIKICGIPSCLNFRHSPLDRRKNLQMFLARSLNT